MTDRLPAGEPFVVDADANTLEDRLKAALDRVAQLEHELATRPAARCTTPSCHGVPAVEGECWTCPRCVQRLVKAERRCAVSSSLDEALNSGDGSYKP